jgi:hypothetical protein
MDNTEQVLAPSYSPMSAALETTGTKFVNLFDRDARKMATKVLDYYDGQQSPYLEEILKKIRRNAMESGMTARSRNIVRMIADKSGMLFSGKPPVLEVAVDNSRDQDVTDDAQTATALEYFESADWIEFFTNFDIVVRLLKTALVMVYWVAETNTIKFITLDQHNSAVHYDQNTGEIDTLIYSTGQTVDDQGNVLDNYRIWSETLIQDIIVDAQGEERIVHVEDNPYGEIPVAVFHDTNIPRENFWNSIPNDLVEINEIYNIHLSDSEYAAAWNKHQTAITNATIKADDSSPDFVEKQLYLNPLTRRVQAGGPAAIGGPGRIIELETVGGVAPYFEYKGPNANLLPMDDMVKNWVIDFAQDWSVNASMAGNGSADSGFKLVVMEMPNLELRKKRQRMMEAGFERLFEIVKLVVNKWNPGTFTDSAELEVSFGNPELPIDEKLNEEVWSRKIAEGRASRVDYFMEVKGMTQSEAIAKVQEIMAYNAVQLPPQRVVQLAPPVPTVPTKPTALESGPDAQVTPAAQDPNLKKTALQINSLINTDAGV